MGQNLFQTKHETVPAARDIYRTTISRKIWSVVGTKQWTSSISRQAQKYSSVFSTFPNYFSIEEFLIELFRETAFQ